MQLIHDVLLVLLRKAHARSPLSLTCPVARLHLAEAWRRRRDREKFVQRRQGRLVLSVSAIDHVLVRVVQLIGELLDLIENVRATFRCLVACLNLLQRR